MRIKGLLSTLLFLFSFLSIAWANPDMTSMMASEHGGGTFHMFRLETDYGVGKNGAVASWDLDGWAGSDENKLWIKSEGEHKDNKLESAEFWALYSHNVATFWDAQAGVRYDVAPSSTGYLVLGTIGLAPYFFETEAHLFISGKGDASARLREENDFLLTQKLILQPYAEVNLNLQDVPERDLGAGLSDGQIGLQTRYEFTRKFAPYVDVHYDRKFGETSSIAKSIGEDNEDLIGTIGLRLMF
jgi:copper resistance protein B